MQKAYGVKNLSIIFLLTILLMIVSFCAPQLALADDNNTWENATEITVLDQLYTDHITYSGEANWFKITVDHTCSIVSNVTTNNGTCRYTIYDSSMNQLSTNLYGSSFTGNYSYKVTPGTYYMKISPYTSVNYATNTITIKCNLREQDAYENNDISANATTLTPGQTYSDIRIEAVNDADWFTITVDHTCSLVSQINNNYGTYHYYICDSSLNVLYHDYLGTSPTCYGYKFTPGTYYIKISSYAVSNYLTNSISMTVNLREQDTYENNDISANATALTPGQTYSDIGIEAVNDADWFTITVDHTCSLVSQISTNNGQCYYNVYDSSLNQLYSGNFGTSPTYYGYKVTPGTYYIKIGSYSNVNYLTNSISMTVNLREQDAYENNDISDNATILTPGQTLTDVRIEAYNDPDWFTISVDHTCYIISNFSNFTGLGYYKMYDSALTQIYSSLISTSSPSFSKKVDPGVYYIKISPYTSESVNFNANSFSLRVSLSKEYDFTLTYGNPSFNTFAGEPVNMVNGNYYSQDRDLSIPTRSVPLEFTRYYNSRSADVSSLGKGWQHNYNSYLTFNPGLIGVTYADGHSSLFQLLGGVYIGQEGVYETIVKNVDNTYTLTFKNQIKYHYNSSGKLIEIIDKNNNITTLQYTNSLLSSVTEPGGRSLQFTYDANDNLTLVTDPASRTLVFTYNVDGNLATAQDLNDNVTTYAYDIHGITTVTDAKNHIIVLNTYDTNSKVVQQEDGKGNVSYMTYDPVARQNTYEDALGNITTYYYDTKYRLTRIVYPDQTDTLYTYDSNYNKLTETDPRGNTTTFTYDSMGNLLTQTSPAPLNYVTTFAYDSKNNVTTLTDALGHLITYTYDANGNCTQSSETISAQTAEIDYTYDQYGQVLTITNANGIISSFTYDANGNVLETEDANSHTTTYTYDTIGNKLTKTNALNKTWTYTYDDAGHILTETDPLSGVMTCTYDQTGNILTQTDQNSQTITYGYDENDRLVQTTDPLDHIATITYDANGNKTASTDVNGHTTTYTYDSRNRMLTSTDAEEATITYTLDANGNILTQTDGNGKTTAYEYDALNRLVTTTDPLTFTTEKTYDALGNVLSITDSNDNTTTYTYNEKSQLLTETDALSNVTTITYDLVGNKTSETDARDKTWVYTYDNVNQLTQVTDPTSHNMQLAYDACGNIVTKTDENGHQTTYTFDDLNRVSTVTDSLSNVTSYTYDGVGNVLTITDANNHVTTYTYDDLSRMVTDTDALSNSTTYAYDAVGNIISITDDIGHVWEYTYDDADRIVSITDPLDNESQVSYDANGNIISKIDANSEETEFAYDDCGRLESVTDALDNVTTYLYDANGNLLEITNAKDKVRTFEYDALNRLISDTDQLDNEDSWTYDEVGNVLTHTKPGSITIDYTYDDLSRLTGITYPDQSQVIYTYDPTGKRLSMTDPNGSTTYTYYNNDLLETVTRDGDAISYLYDSVGNITRITYPDNTQANYTYTDTNNIDTVEVNNNILDIDYNDLGQPTLEDMPNGVETIYQYDQDNRLTLIAYDLGATTLASSSYEYDNVGNRVELTNENDESTEFTYDPLGQLTEVTYPDNTSAQYTYDAVGNRATTSGTAEDPLMKITGSTTLIYDYEDRLISVDDGLKEITYTYDGDGNLIGKTITDSQTASYEYLYDYSQGLPRLLVETEGENTYNYIYANKLYSRIGPDGEELYYHQDGLGSTVAITDDSGAVQNRYTYDAFGNPTTLLSTVENSILFTGELSDQSGYIYLRARYYDPASGRFITKDSVNGYLDSPATQNLYSYCGNNPVNYIDPSGNSRCYTGLGEFVFDPNNPPSIDIEIVKSLVKFGIVPVLQYVGEVVDRMFLWLDMYLEMQRILDAAELIPGLPGDIASLVNATIYLSNGDYKNAGISVSGLIPFMGAAGVIERFTARSLGDVAEFAAKAGRAGEANKLYHYTSANPESILKNGLQPGSSGKVFTTPTGNLSPLQAQIDLALPPNRGLPQHLIEVDIQTLKNMGIEIPQGQQVPRMFNMPGGGTEVVFPHAIPFEALSIIK